MNTLVVFYSLQGNTRLIAENIAEATGADLMEIKPVKEISAKGWTKYLIGGKQAMKKERPEILPLDKNPQEYDYIFIGTPVWAWTYTPPILSFFDEANLKGKKIAIFCCHGGGMGNTLAHMKKALPGNEIIGEIDFQDPLKKNKSQSEQQAKEWARSLLGI